MANTEVTYKHFKRASFDYMVLCLQKDPIVEHFRLSVPEGLPLNVVVAFIQGTAVGYWAYYFVEEDLIESFMTYVVPAQRRKGIATATVGGFFWYSSPRRKRIYLCRCILFSRVTQGDERVLGCTHPTPTSTGRKATPF